MHFPGIKFIIISDTKQQKVEELLRKIYELYSDYVLKNPFYSLDMPIRYDLKVRFVIYVQKLCFTL